MIFQINYQSSGKYDAYFYQNRKYIAKMDHKIFRDIEIEAFLDEYSHADMFHSLKIHPMYEYARTAILCDVLRLLILYEIGGIYLDADCIFEPEIVLMEQELERSFGSRNLVMDTRSLFFIKGQKQSEFINYLLSLYLNAEYLTLDVFMINKHKISVYFDSLNILSTKYLTKFFRHEQMTTNDKRILHPISTDQKM